jgi:hypothetical protein
MRNKKQQMVDEAIEEIIATHTTEQLISGAEAGAAGMGHLEALEPDFDKNHAWWADKVKFMILMVAGQEGAHIPESELKLAIKKNRDAHLRGALPVSGCELCK